MAKRLYEVRIDTIAYVLAEDAHEAESFERQILQTEPVNISARPVTPNAVLAWPDGCLVYGTKHGMTIAEAVAQFVEAKP